MASPQPIDIAYQLPTTLQSIQNGWIASSQTAATVSALIAAGNSQLLSFMKGINITDTSEPFASHPAAYSVMLGFLYTGLFLSISATVTPLIITEMFSELPLSAARRRADAVVRDSLHSEGNISESVPALLRRYGMRKGLRPVQWHWFFCFIFGIILSVLSVWIYVIIEESLAMKILITFVVAFSLWPCFNFYVKTDITLPGVPAQTYPLDKAVEYP